jgi:O-antigen ligase
MLIFGIMLSFLSGILNQNSFWFLHFIISLDFFFYGVLFCSFTLKPIHIKVLKQLLLFYFIYNCAQQVLVPLGVVTVETNYNYGDYGGIVRIGTSIGSSIASGYFILIMSGILIYLYKDNKIMKNIVKIIAGVAILLTLSRGPIISFVLVMIIDLVSRVSFKSLTAIGLVVCGIYFLNLESNVMNIIKNRFLSEDVTSGRDTRWDKTIDVYKSNSVLIGAGNNLVPIQRSALSGVAPVVGKTTSPHNFYLSFLVETGALGLFNILVLMSFLFIYSYKLRNTEMYPKFTFLVLFLTLVNLEIILRDGLFAFLFWLFFFILDFEVRKNIANYNSNY